MALGSVAISGGMSKKTKERLMYMDGKLVWSAAMGASGGMSAKAPDTVDYLVIKPVASNYGASSSGPLGPGATEVRVARGGSAATSACQYGESSSFTHYVTVTFASDGTIRLSYPSRSLYGCISVEGYQYL